MSVKIPKIWEHVLFIVEYLYTEFTLIFAPSKTFSQIFSKKPPRFLINAELFLIINILITYLVYEIPTPISFDIDIFPSILVKDLTKSGLELLSVYFKFIIGIVIFLAVLRFCLRSYKIETFSRKCYRVVCYVSAIYYPSATIGRYSAKFPGSSIHRIGEKMYSNLDWNIITVDFVNIVIWLLINIILLLWWIRMVYIGFQYLLDIPAKKISNRIICSWVLFFIIQCFIWLGLLCVKFLPTITVINNIDKIKQVEFEKPINYFKAAMLYDEIASIQIVSPRNRYMSKMYYVVYMMKTVLFDQKEFENIFIKCEELLKANKFYEAEKVISKYLTNNSSEADEIYYRILLNGLKEAHNYTHLKDYSEDDTASITTFSDIYREPVPVIFP